MPGWLQTLLMSAGVAAVLQGVVQGVFNRRKVEGEGKEHESNAFDKLTDAQIDRQINAIESAERETLRAQEACNKCERKLSLVERRLTARDEATDALIDAVLEFLRLLPDLSAERTAPVRAAITTARRARHNWESE